MLGLLLIAVVVAGVVLGLMIIVATGLGKEVSFDGIFPTNRRQVSEQPR